MARKPNINKEILISPYIQTGQETSDRKKYKGFLVNNYLKHFAFIDETYLDPEHGKPGFYFLTAVIVKNGNIPSLREKLLQTNGNNYWHTTEAHVNKKGRREQILPMMRCASSNGEESLISTYQEIPYPEGDENTAASLNQTREKVRRVCLYSLGKRLAETYPSLSLVVETPDVGTHEDLVTLMALKKHRPYQGVQHTFFSPYIEPLLWTADLCSWALRRHVINGEDVWIRLSNFQVRLFDAKNNADVDLNSLSQEIRGR